MNDKISRLNELRVVREESAGRGARAKWLIAGGIAAALALAAWFLLGGQGAVPVRVAVARAAPGAAADSAALLDASGYVVARRQATVAAKITDKVTEVLIEEGQRVEGGQIIARLDDTNTSAALAQAQAQLLQAEANLAAARTAEADNQPIFLRQRKLVHQGWVSETAFDNAKAAYDATVTARIVAEKALATAQAALVVAQRNQDDTIVRAPYAGVVTVKAAQAGEVVSPISAGGGFTRTGIGTIVDMDSLEVEVDVSENFIHRVHAGQAAEVRLNAYPDAPYPAHVIAVIPTADRSKATVKVRVGFDRKDERILPEMGARVAFLADRVATPGAPALGHAVLVPADAVQGTGDTGTVYVLHEDHVERRSVRLGARSGADQIVLSGIAAGDRLAIGDPAKLIDGAKVAIGEGAG